MSTPDVATQLMQSLQELTYGHHPSELFEIRALGVRREGGKPRTYAGWFTPAQIERAAQQVAEIDGLAGGIYAVANPIAPSARTELGHLADHFGRLKPLPPKAEGERRPWSTTDAMIARRAWLLIDCDPVRPADQNATDAEKALARELLGRVQDDQPCPPALICDSGNGWHGLWRISDAAASDSVHRLLKACDWRYSTDRVTVDVKVGNASRIVKLYGTLAKKGPDTPTRPHRRSRIAELVHFTGWTRTLLGDELVAWADALGYRPEPAPAPVAATIPFRRPDPDGSRPSAIERAALWLERADPAVSGSNGHGTTFRVVCSLGPGFDLAPEDCFHLLWSDYNPRCSPPWSEKELRHKVEQAYQVEKRRGWLLEAGGDPPPVVQVKSAALAGPPAEKPPAALKPTGPAPEDAPAPVRVANPPRPRPVTGGIRDGEGSDDPQRMARMWRDLHVIEDAGDWFYPLAYWQGDSFRWMRSHWEPWPVHEMKVAFAAWLKPRIEAVNAARSGKPKVVDGKFVNDVLMHLAGLCLIERSRTREAPIWIGEPPAGWPRDARNVLATPTCIVDITRPERPTLPPTPRLFNTQALATPFDPAAECPAWLRFLGECWPTDAEAPALLQEWFGYCLVPDITHHKMLALIGVRRSGKGTIARALEAMLGSDSVSRPTLGDFARPFGMEQLIGKAVTVVGDARLSHRADQALILERLLSISGGDNPSVDRKNRTQWQGGLTSKIMLLSNEPPELSDPSGALASRFLFLETRVSFEGREDTELGSRLAAETPGILNWSLAGLDRLRAQRRFTEPGSSARLRERMEELTAPVRAFVADRCELAPDAQVIRSDLYRTWVEWAKEEGYSDSRIGNAGEFGVALLAAFPSIESPEGQVRIGGKRVRVYRGIGFPSALPF